MKNERRIKKKGYIISEIWVIDGPIGLVIDL